MPPSLDTAMSNNNANGVVERVELAAPIAQEQVKTESKALPHSKAAQRSAFITGGLLAALIYLLAERRWLERIEEKS
jgi:hypothetical protein